MAVAIDTFSGNRVSAIQTQVDTAISGGVAANSDRVLFALINTVSSVAPSVSTVAYQVGSGGAWAFVGARSAAAGLQRVEIWRSIAPASGATTIRVTLASATDAGGDLACIVYSLYNAHQTTPEADYTSKNAGNDISVPTTSNDMALYALCAAGNPGAITAGTEDYTDVFNAYHRTAHRNDASSAAFSYTSTSSEACNGVNVKAAAASGPTPIPSPRRLVSFQW